MPDVANHLAKVRSNKSILNHIGNAEATQFPDWYVTITFYTAVHIVEAIIYQEKNSHSKDHDDREKQLMKIPVLDRSFLTAYRTLYQQSKQARYMTNKKFTMNHDDCKDALHNLETIETECKDSYFTNYPNG